MAIVLAVLAARTLRSRSVANLPTIATVPAFQLQDQNAAPVTLDDLTGKVWIASFLYTTCPGPCPRLVEQLAAIRRDFAGDPRVMLVSFSVDPDADSPEVLAAYARAHGIDARGWKLLTGPAETVYAFIRSGFLLAVERVDAAVAQASAEQGPVAHSTRLVLVDASRRIRAYYDTTDARALEDLRAGVRALLAEIPP